MRLIGLLAVLVLLPACRSARQNPSVEELQAFEGTLERLRAEHDIPGMSAAVARDGRIVWAEGFGYADQENGVRATAETVYPIASLTKPFASTVVLQLVQEGRLSLEDPVSKYGVEGLDTLGTVRLKHLLSHTSRGVPGAAYAYSGGRYALLDRIIPAATGRSFGEHLRDRIVRPLRLEYTAPNVQDTAAFALFGHRLAEFEKQLAKGYAPDGKARVQYPPYFGASAGLMSTAVDVARYAAALDEGRLLPRGSLDLAWTPFVGNDGTPQPYGLGWFVHEYEGMKMPWHYGLWTGHSALIVKVPERRLSFVLLANSDKLSSPYPLWEDSNVLKSPFARAFVETFLRPRNS